MISLVTKPSCLGVCEKLRKDNRVLAGIFDGIQQ